ncbi:antitoxin VbhA family protein [Deinococcus antarcticus]|uniref:Antitoxin VbhA family protein n=1 Tax=Deinococcus antarcticus TaxID=1298767 RepID=A0ABV8A2M8_9DEIO
MTALPQPATITNTERTRRQKAVDAARASVRLEGFILDDVVEGIYARYVAGALEMDEVIALVDRHAGLSD